jgi:hypothetical protein
MITLTKQGMVRGIVGALMWSAGSGLVWAQTTQSARDVNTVLAAVQQAYPNPKALCGGGLSSIRSAVTESLPGVAKQLKTTPRVVAEDAVQRLWSNCPR